MSRPHLRRLLFATLLAAPILLAGCGGMHMRLTPLGTQPGKMPPIRLFPLLHTEPEPPVPAGLEVRGYDPTPGHFTAAWPFFQYRYRTDPQGRRHSFFGLHPLFARERLPTRPEGHGDTYYTDFLWPLFQLQRRSFPDGTERGQFFFPFILRQWRTSPEGDGTIEKRKRFFVFPFWWSGSREWEEDPTAGEPLPGAEEARTGKRWYTTLFPFVWLSRGEPADFPRYNPKGAGQTMFWPFYGSIPEYGPPGSRRRFGFFLWPFFLWSESLDDPGQKSFTFLWPFFRAQWGGTGGKTGDVATPKVREIKAWPLFGWLKKDDRYRAYLLWPLIIWRNASTEEHVDKQRMIFPLYFYSHYKEAMYRIFFSFSGSYRDENERATFILWPLFARWTHDEDQFKETQILWHIFRWRTGTGETPNTIKQFVPFFRFFNNGKKEQWYHPILLWHGTRRERYDGDSGQNYMFNGRYSFPLFFSKRRDYDDGTYGYARFVFPFGLWQRTRDGSTRSRTAWLFWQEDFQGMQRNWTPLWSFNEARKMVLRPEEGGDDTGAKKSLETSLFAGDEAAERDDAADAAAVRAELEAREFVKRRHWMGYLYRSEFGPGIARRHLNFGPFAYDRIGDQRAVSFFGGWLPVVWGDASDEEQN